MIADNQDTSVQHWTQASPTTPPYPTPEEQVPQTMSPGVEHFTLDGSWIATPATTYDIMKRMFDLVVAGIMFVIVLPIMLVLAVLIRLDSPGPAIFQQKRVARGGRLFTFYKFRSMWVDARERFPEFYNFSYTPDQVQSIYLQFEEDPRVTRLGKFIRRTSLDELPNLIHIIHGDMSLVGPRPELPDVIRYYTPEQLAKFSVKPGLTGLAQIRGRGDLSMQETIAADLEYVQNRSFWHDIQILLATVQCVVLKKGAF